MSDLLEKNLEHGAWIGTLWDWTYLRHRPEDFSEDWSAEGDAERVAEERADVAEHELDDRDGPDLRAPVVLAPGQRLDVISKGSCKK